MKKIRIASMALVLVMLFSVFALSSCSTYILIAEYEGKSITSNMFSYMLSSQKASIELDFGYNYYQTMGSWPDNATIEAYWKSSAGYEDDPNKTVAQAVYENMVNAVKTFVVLEHLCDKYNIELTDQSTIDSIESYMQEDIETAGDINTLNILLSKYGASADIQQEYLTLTSKISVLFDYLYGDNGTQRLSDDVIRKEFDDTYEKLEFMNFSFYDYDDDGNSTIKQDNSITEGQRQEKFENDYYKIRHIVFYYYNNKIEMDEAGKTQQKEKAQEMFDRIQNEELTFDQAVLEGPVEPGMITQNATGGIYQHGGFVAGFDEDAALAMEVGEVSLIYSDVGAHIVLKVEKTEEDYTKMKEEVYKQLLIEKTTQKAKDFYDDLEAGKVEFKTTPDGAGVLEEEPIIYTEGDITDKELLDIIDPLKIGEYAYTEFAADGVYIFKKCQKNDDDYELIESSLRKYLSETAFYTYLESFHPTVKLNQAEIDKYDMLTVLPLSITATE